MLCLILVLKILSDIHYYLKGDNPTALEQPSGAICALSSATGRALVYRGCFEKSCVF